MRKLMKVVVVVAVVVTIHGVDTCKFEGYKGHLDISFASAANSNTSNSTFRVYLYDYMAVVPASFSF